MNLKYNNTALLSLLLLLLSLTSFKSNATCNFSIEENSQKLTWTGYKFTNKKAVPGTFDDISFEQTVSKSLKELMESIKFVVNTDSLNSENPARDTTLKATVFNLLKEPQKISGSIDSYSKEKSLAVVKMTFNQDISVDFKTNYNEKTGVFEASGSLDLMNNGFKPNYDAVHESCEKLHTGEDGVSKTWSTVDLKITAKIKQECGIFDKLKKLFN